MKINIKSEKGAITLVVLIGMIFLTVFLMSVYIQISNKAQSSAEITEQIAKQYNNIDDAEDIYASYFSDINVVPIYNAEQLKKIGSGEEVLIEGKIYVYAPDAYYTIKNNIDLGGLYDEATGEWSGETWTPITDTFTGILDGLGHKVTGLYINNSNNNQGLFGVLKGTVKNLKIQDSYVNGRTDELIAGKNEGTIENCITGNDGSSLIEGEKTTS